MKGMLGSYKLVENRASIVAFQPTIGGDRTFTLAVGSRVHKRDAVPGAQKKARVFDNPHSIVRDSVKQKDPGTVRMGGADFPAVKKRAIGCSDVERFAVNAILPEQHVGLPDQIRSERAADRMEKRRSHEPS
jgi:hypothetical protein